MPAPRVGGPLGRFTESEIGQFPRRCVNPGIQHGETLSTSLSKRPPAVSARVWGLLLPLVQEVRKGSKHFRKIRSFSRNLSASWSTSKHIAERHRTDKQRDGLP
jgi:hypothetical protein